MLCGTVMVCLLMKEASAIAMEECSVKPDGSSTCPDQTTLIQSRVQVALDSSDGSGQARYGHTYTSNKKSATLLQYFINWAQPAIDGRLARIVLSSDSLVDIEAASNLQTGTEMMSAASASKLFEAKAMQDCPKRAAALVGQTQFTLLHAAPVDERGLRHLLLKGNGAQLQYMASYRFRDREQVLVADPPACSDDGQLAFLEASRGEPEPKKESSDPLAGGSTMLTNRDHLVTDCKDLFVRTVEENCHKTVDITVNHAHRSIIDGLSVHMKVKVCETGSLKCHLHWPECDFEIAGNHTDANLLQMAKSQGSPTQNANKTLPEEAEGLVATLRLHVPICESYVLDGVNGDEAEEHTLLSQFAMGEISHYKGFEHINDNIPLYTSSLEVDPPTELDFRTKYAGCYPKRSGHTVAGTETMRDQGACGSCWAFAGATTAMVDFCISGQSGTLATQAHAMASVTDRLEVSVQKLMSCSGGDGGHMRGCDGGSMGVFEKQAWKYGLTKERENLYKCGAGDPKKHFESKNACNKFPWGGTCSGGPNADWWWGGAMRVDGETDMMSVLASGSSLYVSMAVYPNFFGVTNNIYTQTSGQLSGYHALNSLGYGTDGGTKYWLLQNSWGTGWGHGGFARILRGTNLADIEKEAFTVRAWVTGGRTPLCQDGANAGISATGLAPFWPCSESKRYCHWSAVQGLCPVTCGKCKGVNGRKGESKQMRSAAVPSATTQPPTTPQAPTNTQPHTTPQPATTTQPSATSQAPRPPTTPQAERKTKTVTFHPGGIGISADWGSGLITTVHENGQGEQNGVMVGMRFLSIDNATYTEALLDAKIAGKTDYTVTFAVRAAEPSTAAENYTTATQHSHRGWGCAKQTMNFGIIIVLGLSLLNQQSLSSTLG